MYVHISPGNNVATIDTINMRVRGVDGWKASTSYKTQNILNALVARTKHATHVIYTYSKPKTRELGLMAASNSDYAMPTVR